MNIAGQFGLNACITISLPIQYPPAEMYRKGNKCVLRLGHPLHTYCCRQFTHIYITFMIFHPARFLYNLLLVLYMPFPPLMSISSYFSLSMTCHGTSEKQSSNWYSSDDLPLVLDLPSLCAVILNNQCHGTPCFSLVCCLQYAKAEIISVSLFFSCSRKNVYPARNLFWRYLVPRKSPTQWHLLS